MTAGDIRQGSVVLPCAELEPNLEFFTTRLDFRLDSIWPADQPAVAILSGHGLRLRLEVGARGAAPVLTLPTADAGRPPPADLVAPCGARIVFEPEARSVALPPLVPAFVHTPAADGDWGAGRAGMQYRDLIPSRLGGHCIASHIRIPVGGPVPDYVHFHRIQLQLIFCHRGWVRVVYEDQGEPFVMHAGDCVLQPPGIRHQVLECSDGLEVVELSCPAQHETHADHALELPNRALDSERDFEGQRFVFDRAATAVWRATDPAGARMRDLGLAAATDSAASAALWQVASAGSTLRGQVASELHFDFVRSGTARFVSDAGALPAVEPAAALTLPPGCEYAYEDCSADFELLRITRRA